MDGHRSQRQPGPIRKVLNWIITNTAWLLADWFGWKTALAVYPPTLTDKVAIVSGANSGIGLETTKALYEQGATVVMACRNLGKADAAKRELVATYGPEAQRRIIPLHMDLEDFASIKRFAGEFRKLNLPLHVLVNNAGIHLAPFKFASHGFERTMAANFFGHAYLIDLLLDKLQTSTPSRIVNMGSVFEATGAIGLYTRRLPWDDLKGSHLTDSGERPYCLSKTMLMMYSRVLAEKLRGSGVDVFAVHPGVVNSGWYDKCDRQSYLFSWLIWNVGKRISSAIPVGQHPATGALSAIYAATAPELTGRSTKTAKVLYFGPSYFLVNFFNTSQRWMLNPWFYNKGACRELFQKAQDILKQVDKDVGPVDRAKEMAEAMAPINGTAAGSVGSGGASGNMKSRAQQQQVTAAPVGIPAA